MALSRQFREFTYVRKYTVRSGDNICIWPYGQVILLKQLLPRC